MASLIDISLPLCAETPSWPGSPGFRLEHTLRIARGDAVNNSAVHADLHIGTHVDAPWHFLEHGATIEELALDDFVGPAWVAHFPDAEAITPDLLEAAGIPPGTRRLLFRTRNSALWAARVPAFRRDYVALTAAAARWIVGRGIRLAGCDYLSIQRFEDGPETHHVLLGARVVVLEGLNLAGVAPGPYELLCLPLRLLDAEGAPARAVLRPLTGEVRG